MGIYTDDDDIIGLRILIEMPHGGGDYYIKYEFTDVNWKQQAIYYLPQFIGQKGVKIQTLHPFSTSHNLQTGQHETPGTLWLDNFYITVEQLLA
jgi:hypothetical protein